MIYSQDMNKELTAADQALRTILTSGGARSSCGEKTFIISMGPQVAENANLRPEGPWAVRTR